MTKIKVQTDNIQPLRTFKAHDYNNNCSTVAASAESVNFVIEPNMKKRYVMFDFLLFFKLIPYVFSLQKGHLRYPSSKRILVVLLFFPLFLLITLTHGIFFLLDEIFFPGYHKQPNTQTAFITGVPRSATTFILYTLMKEKHRFTGFTLGEALFAPDLQHLEEAAQKSRRHRINHQYDPGLGVDSKIIGERLEGIL